MALFLLAPVAIAAAPVLSPAAIAGIVTGGAAVVGAGASALWYFFKPKLKRQKLATQQSVEDTKKTLEMVDEDNLTTRKKVDSANSAMRALSDNLNHTDVQNEKKAENLKDVLQMAKTVSEKFAASLPLLKEMVEKIPEKYHKKIEKELEELDRLILKREGELIQATSDIRTLRNLLDKQVDTIANLSSDNKEKEEIIAEMTQLLNRYKGLLDCYEKVYPFPEMPATQELSENNPSTAFNPFSTSLM